jgi:hypothetical protein
MYDEPQAQLGAPDRQQLRLFMLVDGEDECDPEREAARVSGHGTVGVVQSLDNPRGGALLELFEESMTGGHEFFVGARWERDGGG